MNAYERAGISRRRALGAAGVFLITAACSPEKLSGPTVPVAKRAVFAAWSNRIVDSSIPLQTMSLDVNQSRQFTGLVADSLTLSFAAAHPGQLYINGDEPDQQCISPADYAVSYHDWAQAIKAADPSARLSPAGFAEPNAACSGPHSSDYAEQFYDAYRAKYGAAPPVSEWRFHDFGLGLKGNVAAWWARVQALVNWSEAHGAPMVLGSWGFLDWDEPTPVFLAHVREAMALVQGESRITQAVWWSYEQIGMPHFLKNADGTLTEEGQLYSATAGRIAQ